MSEYFSHDYNARNDLKLKKLFIKEGLSGIGLYWCLVEMLYEEGGYMDIDYIPVLAFDYRVDEATVTRIINDYDLFKTNGTNFYSDSILKRLNIRQEKSEKAKKSVSARWGRNTNEEQEQYERNTNVIRTNNERNTNEQGYEKKKEAKKKEKEKEKGKGKDKIENIIVDDDTLCDEYSACVRESSNAECNAECNVTGNDFDGEAFSDDLKFFCDKYGIVIDDYNCHLSELKFDKLDKAYAASKWLRDNFTVLSKVCKHYEKIISGTYADEVKSTQEAVKTNDYEDVYKRYPKLRELGG